MSRRIILGLIVSALLLASSGTALGAAAPVPGATVKIQVGKLNRDRAPIYATVPVTGSMAPFVAGQTVEVNFYLNSHPVLRRSVSVKKGSGDSGYFSTSIVVRKDGRYAVSATHPANPALGADTTPRKSWKVSFPSLHPGECGNVVGGFKAALARMGYASGGGSCFNARLGREVLAYRKVNSMGRDQQAGASHRGSGLRRPGRLPGALSGSWRTR